MKSRILKRSVAVIVIAAAFLVAASAVYADDGTVKVSVEGKYGQTEARSMLSLINHFRTNEGTTEPDQAWWLDPDGSGERIAVSGLKPLVYDYGLEESAMQRAAELALSFSHTRPDGSDSLDLPGVNAENIAYGYGMTAEEAFDAWLEADETSFSGQGHRSNMLGGYFVYNGTVYRNFLNAVGIGHFKYNGVDYWVQDFGQYESGNPETPASDGTETVEVSAKKSMVTKSDIELGTPISVEYGKTVDLADADIMTYGTIGGKRFPVSSEYTWENVDTEYALLDGTLLTGLKVGTGKLTVTNSFDKVVSFDVTVAPCDISSADVSAEKTEFMTGEIIWYFRSVNPKVVLDGKELEFGTDYCMDIKSGYQYYAKDHKYDNTGHTAEYQETMEYTFKGMGQYTGTVLEKLYVNVVPNTDLHISTDHAAEFSLEYAGESEKISLNCGYMYRDEPLEITISDTSVVSVSQETNYYTDTYDLTVVPEGVGTSEISVKFPDKEGAYSASNTLTFTVTVGPGNLANAVVGGLDPLYEYTGSPIKPEPLVYLSDDLLVKGTDYDLTYMIDGAAIENPVGNPGKKTEVAIAITGKGERCYGTYLITYMINPVTLEFSLESEYTYSKAGVKPVPVVTHDGKELALDQDYEITYGANDKVGEDAGSVTVTGIGDYTVAGSVTKYFDITACDISDAEISAEKTEFVTGETVWYFRSVGPKVIVNGEELEYGTDYCLDIKSGYQYYQQNYKYDYYGHTSTYEETMEYTFKGMGNYSGTASEKLYVNVVPNTDIHLTTEHETEFSLEYRGESEKIEVMSGFSYFDPQLEIEISDESVISAESAINFFIDGYDVTVTPKKAGTATLSVMFKEVEGSHSASNVLTFNVTVEKADYSKFVTAELSDPSAEYYYVPGRENRPAVKVYEGYDLLNEGDDYVLTYEDNVFAGTGYAVITPADTDNYKGEIRIPFEIKPQTAELVLSSEHEEIGFGEEKVIEFSGAASKETPVLTVDGDAVTAELTEFGASGKGKITLKGVKLGDAVVHFEQEGDNRYTGTSGEISVTVKPVTVDEDDVEIGFKEDEFTYTGDAIEPEITVSVNGVTVSSDTYDISYENNIEPGTGKIKVTGKGGVEFSKEAEFAITLADTSDLKSAADEAEELLSKIPVSADGKDILTSDNWVDKGSHDALSGAIQEARNFMSSEKYTPSELGQMKTKLENAVTSFRNAVKKGSKVLTVISEDDVSLVSKAVWTGSEIEPEVTVKSGDTVLVSGTDYDVEFSDNVKVGIASVTVTGKGDYTGSVTKTFRINPKGTKLGKIKAGKKSFTAKWKKQAKETTGYQIQYSLKKKFKPVKKTLIKKNRITKKVIKKLKAKKLYYVRIRTYKKTASGTFYSSWSKTGKVKTK